MRFVHGNAKAGKKSKTYKIWCGMKSRCSNRNEKAFKNYGGRGISVCQRWADSYAAFLEDMGECPDGYSIERIDNDRDYEPSNCKWIPRECQSTNRRTVNMIAVGDEKKSLADWARSSGLSLKTICSRINSGWPPELAVSMPKLTSRAGLKINQPLWAQQG